MTWQERIVHRAIATGLANLRNAERHAWQQEEPYEPTIVMQAEEKETCSYCAGEGGEFPNPCPVCHDTGWEPITAPELGPWEVV